MFEWVCSCPGDLSDPRDQASCTVGRFFMTEPPEAQFGILYNNLILLNVSPRLVNVEVLEILKFKDSGLSIEGKCSKYCQIELYICLKI